MSIYSIRIVLVSPPATCQHCDLTHLRTRLWPGERGGTHDHEDVRRQAVRILWGGRRVHHFRDARRPGGLPAVRAPANDDAGTHRRAPGGQLQQVPRQCVFDISQYYGSLGDPHCAAPHHHVTLIPQLVYPYLQTQVHPICASMRVCWCFAARILLQSFKYVFPHESARLYLNGKGSFFGEHVFGFCKRYSCFPRL